MQSSYTFHRVRMVYGFEKSILVYYGQSESAYPFDGWNVCTNIVEIIPEACCWHFSNGTRSHFVRPKEVHGELAKNLSLWCSLQNAYNVYHGLFKIFKIFTNKRNSRIIK